MMKKAIQTNYKGCRFRSRLEARWAVFFDALGIEWLYEPEGFENVDLDGKVTRYLPDFYLPDSGTWVEVKGAMGAIDANKLAAFLSGGQSLPWFIESSEMSPYQKKKFTEIARATGAGHGYPGLAFAPGLLLLGNIPEVGEGFVTHKMLVNEGHTIFAEYVEFNPMGNGGPVTIDRVRYGIRRDIGDLAGQRFESLGFGADYCDDLAKVFAPDDRFIRSELSHKLAMDAYRAARAARFEYGA